MHITLEPVFNSFIIIRILIENRPFLFIVVIDVSTLHEFRRDLDRIFSVLFCSYLDPGRRIQSNLPSGGMAQQQILREFYLSDNRCFLLGDYTIKGLRPYHSASEIAKC